MMQTSHEYIPSRTASFSTLCRRGLHGCAAFGRTVHDRVRLDGAARTSRHYGGRPCFQRILSCAVSALDWCHLFAALSLVLRRTLVAGKPCFNQKHPVQWIFSRLICNDALVSVLYIPFCSGIKRTWRRGDSDSCTVLPRSHDHSVPAVVCTLQRTSSTICSVRSTIGFALSGLVYLHAFYTSLSNGCVYHRSSPFFFPALIIHQLCPERSLSSRPAFKPVGGLALCA